MSNKHQLTKEEAFWITINLELEDTTLNTTVMDMFHLWQSAMFFIVPELKRVHAWNTVKTD